MNRLLARILLLVITSVLTLAVLEGAVRVYAVTTNRVRGMTFDRELGWKPVPNVMKSGSIWGTTRPASSNSRGWRDREHPLTKPAGTIRAVALGDSFTFGVDVDDGERFTDLLPGLAGSLEVVNLGVAGYGIDQYLRVLETEGLLYQPDVVIMTVCVYNDMTDIGYERIYSWPKPYYLLKNGQLELHKPDYTWEMRARTWSYLVEVMFQRLQNENLTPTVAAGSSRENAGALFEALVRRIAATTAGHGARLVAVLAYPPHRFGLEYTAVAAEMTGALTRVGVPTLDTRELFLTLTTDPDKTYYLPFGVHWNRDGHRAVAQAVTRLIAPAGTR